MGAIRGRRRRGGGQRGRSEGDSDGILLAALRTGESATIEGFDGGHGLRSRLSALGFTPDAEVKMIQNIGNGPVIVGVRDTRIALGRGEANKVRVRRAASQP